MEHIINVINEKCNACGDCVKDCPQNVIEIEENKANVKHQGCIMCGHCQAVCPEHAIEISGYEQEPVAADAFTLPSAEQILHALRLKRSIRQYKPDAIPEETLRLLLEAAACAPTLKNAQNVQFTILKDKLPEVEALAYKMLPELMEIMKVPKQRQQSLQTEDHFFTFGAPVAVVFSSKKKMNSILAAANMSMMAQSLGLGTLISGFISKAINNSAKLRHLIEIEEKADIVLLIGYPDVQYFRSTQKDAPNVNRQ